jgi:hypothetical protein
MKSLSCAPPFFYCRKASKRESFLTSLETIKSSRGQVGYLSAAAVLMRCGQLSGVVKCRTVHSFAGRWLLTYGAFCYACSPELHLKHLIAQAERLKVSKATSFL